MSIMYHDGNRNLQDRFDSRRIADRLEEKLTRVVFNDDDKALIESVAFFFRTFLVTKVAALWFCNPANDSASSLLGRGTRMGG